MEWKSGYAGRARPTGSGSDHRRGVPAPVGHIALVSLNAVAVAIAVAVMSHLHLPRKTY